MYGFGGFQVKYTEKFVPLTVDEAIDFIVNSLSDEEVNTIKSSESSECHFTTGMYLRNTWHMWDTTNPLSLDFQKRFKLFGHGDDVSGIILTGVWAKVNGKDVDEELNKEADHYRKHWKKQGLDPLTGEKL